jgi:hypothetical protein
MKYCLIILLLVLIITSLFIKRRETYITYPDQSPKTKNIYSCWEHLFEYKNWNIDNFTEQQKKVLLTMRTLNATTYADTKQDFPDWGNSCVIPSDHLLIFNRDPADTSNWLNLRYTKVNESPKGYVINLDKYTESSFKQLLNSLYELYDKEFIDEINRLQKEIDLYTDLKASKKIKLTTLQSDITINNATLNAMLAYDSQCQIDNRRLQTLSSEIAGLRADIATVKSQIPIVPPPAPKSKYFSKPQILDTLSSLDECISNKCLISNNKIYKMCQQGDGNLVLYKNDIAIWATNRFKMTSKLCMQGDGNLVNYSDNQPYWATDKFSTNTPHKAIMQDDGNFVVYDAKGTVLWSTLSGAPKVSIHQHCGYQGWKVELPPGRYSLADLQARGFVNDDASSIKFLRDGKITIFEHDFTGRQATFTSSVNCLVDYGFNDTVSSVIVE